MNWIRDNVILVVLAIVILVQSLSLYGLQRQISALAVEQHSTKEKMATYDGFLDSYLRYIEELKVILDEEQEENKR